jgi:hypothetical protein
MLIVAEILEAYDVSSGWFDVDLVTGRTWKRTSHFSVEVVVRQAEKEPT